MEPYKLRIVTPQKVFFDGEAEQIIVRTTEGDVGILANHTSYVANLTSGPLRIKQPGGEFRIAAVSSGVIKVSQDVTTILATAVEWKDEIDIERAKKAEENARSDMKAFQSGNEFDRAALKLKKALNRISIASK